MRPARSALANCDVEVPGWSWRSLKISLFHSKSLARIGPGIPDIFASEVPTVPAEDPAALARVIRRGWEDEAVRRAKISFGRASPSIWYSTDRMGRWRTRPAAI
jgi:hypothetical protein